MRRIFRIKYLIPSFLFLGIFVLWVNVGPLSRPMTPEAVLHEFLVAYYEGDCEKASKFAIEDATDMINAAVSTGCEPQDVEILSIQCDIRGDEAVCCLKQEYKEWGGVFHLVYGMAHKDNKWYVKALNKFGEFVDCDGDPKDWPDHIMRRGGW